MLDDIEYAIKPDDAHFACSRLLCLENTMGGKLLLMDYILKATRLARRRGLMTHLYDARLFNAAVAQAELLGTDARTEARRIAQCFDSVSFFKGLGTPWAPRTALVGGGPVFGWGGGPVFGCGCW